MKKNHSLKIIICVAICTVLIAQTGHAVERRMAQKRIFNTAVELYEAERYSAALSKFWELDKDTRESNAVQAYISAAKTALDYEAKLERYELGKKLYTEGEYAQAADIFATVTNIDGSAEWYVKAWLQMNEFDLPDYLDGLTVEDGRK